MRSSPAALLLLLGASVLSLSPGCSCSGSDKPVPLPLDEPLSPGQARAGVITKESEVIGGLTARAEVGDYKLYNQRIAVTVGRVGAPRGFQPFGGVLLDADRVRAPGEPGQSAFGEVIPAFDLAILRPDRIEVVGDGRDGSEARVRVSGTEDALPLFDVLLGGLLPVGQHELSWSTDYVLAPDVDWLRIEHTLFNGGSEDIELASIAGFMFGTGAQPFFEGFGFASSNTGASSDSYAAVGPAVSYLYAGLDRSVTALFGESGIVVSTFGDGVTLRTHETKTVTHWLIVGDADLARTQALWRQLSGEQAGTEIAGSVRDESGAPIPGAHVHVTRGDVAPGSTRDYVTRTLAGADGGFRAVLRPGKYRLWVTTPSRAKSEPRDVELGTAPVTGIELVQPRTGTLRYSIKDDQDRPLPAKLSIQSAGPEYLDPPGRFGERDHGPGLVQTELSAHGSGETPLAPGAYQVSVSRGGEYEVVQRSIEITSGETTRLDAALRHSAPTPGWMVSDVHIHAQLSSDSPDLYPFKVTAMAAENIELPVSTEHEAVGDFNPAIRALELEPWMNGIVGTEITTTRYGHFNVFPLVQDRSKPHYGRIEWYHQRPGEIFAGVRAIPGDPFLQVNHPRSPTVGYLEIIGFDRETFTAQQPADLSLDYDALEVINGCNDGVLSGGTILDWFAFLNRGKRVYATGTLDDHNAGRGEMGFPVTYVHTKTEDVRAVTPEAFRALFKAGELVVSCGPFIELRAGSDTIGSLHTLTSSTVELEASVSAPSWMDLDEILVIVGGQVTKHIPLPASSEPLRFQTTVTTTVSPGRDGWVLLWVRGDEPHGVWARGRPSFAFTNPIFLDGDGDGRWGEDR
ncbi:MAG: CehA/McbA family metallohydrolase [Deltaproteobacteria bacterium]|nr:CehA/McbA family metallohydrolase [Deltaproteobacteria bacterium]